MAQLEQLEQQRLREGIETYRLLAPLRDELRKLGLEHERLVFKILDARVRFFQSAKRADAGLEAHGGVRFEKEGKEVYVVWDDGGPLFSDHERAERLRLNPFKRRGPGRQPLCVRRFFPLCNVQIDESPLGLGGGPQEALRRTELHLFHIVPPVSEHDWAGFPELSGGERFTL